MLLFTSSVALQYGTATLQHRHTEKKRLGIQQLLEVPAVYKAILH